MNRTIWTYWHQGFDHAPYLISKCIQQCKALHPNWEIHLLDRNKISAFADIVPIDKEKWNKLQLPHKSDLLRTQMLIKYGGVWLDPTVFCVQPLEDWLPHQMDSGLFLFSQPGRDRVISNWFIASEPNNPILIQLYNELCHYWNHHNFRNLGRQGKGKTEYWLNRIVNRNLEWPRLWFSPLMTKIIRLYPYMVYHYKFYDIIQKNENCRKVWIQMPKISADGPHRLQRIGLLNPISDETKEWMDQKKSPLFKLTWKLEKDDIPRHSTLGYLFNIS